MAPSKTPPGPTDLTRNAVDVNDGTTPRAAGSPDAGSSQRGTAAGAAPALAKPTKLADAGHAERGGTAKKRGPVPAVSGWPSSLHWSQFRAVSAAPDGSKEDAQTATTQPNIPKVKVRQEGEAFHLGEFTLHLALDQNETWVVKGKTSDRLLKHEQRHWDIAGLIAYEMSRRLKSVSAADQSSLTKAVDSVQQELQIKAQALQDWYDDESKHGLDPAGQQTWDDRIAGCIKRDYASLPAPADKYLQQAKQEVGN